MIITTPVNLVPVDASSIPAPPMISAYGAGRSYVG
jgi:hypothetical protein